MPGVSVDGNDVEADVRGCPEARERAIAGGGPTLIEAVTMRMHGHAAHDDMKIRPGRAARAVARSATRSSRRSDGWPRSRDAPLDVAALRAEVQAAIDAATEIALAAPMPDPATATDGLFADEAIPLGDGRGAVSGFARAAEAG